ncbi:hypothetical protein KI387_003612 [Taxus chinensis]|uniref:Pentatricopeptide repeat-containing protein n=1 Tax=Taxus chinensis TaxID=29808 RepID=A0AA38LPV7_TAXCH|nr:hypothetical protein KI387_003612 [Taxus chinensis]
MAKILSAGQWTIHTSAQTLVRNDHNEAMKKLCKIYTSSPQSNLEINLRKCKVKLSPSLVENVLEKFGNAGMVAYRFFQWAGRQEGYVHSLEAYHTMINSLGKIRQYGLMWTLVNTMKSKGVLMKETFCIIIRRYTRVKKLDEAVYAFDIMDKFGVQPDLAAFNSLLSAMCKCKNVRKAQEIFDFMKARYVPDLKTYSILLEGWGKEPHLPKTRDIFREMTEKGCEPDIVAYSILMNALCKGGKIEEAVGLLDTMKMTGCTPNPHIYIILIHSHGAEKNVDDALAVFSEMKRNGCAPETPTYNALIGAFCNVRDLGAAYRVLDEMEQEGVRPNARTFNVILHYLIQQENTEEAYQVDMALKVWKYMGQKQVCPSMHTFSLLINGLCDHGNMNEACIYFDEMIGKGMRPSMATYNRLRKGLLKAGREDILEDLSEKMKELTEEPGEDEMK